LAPSYLRTGSRINGSESPGDFSVNFQVGKIQAKGKAIRNDTRQMKAAKVQLRKIEQLQADRNGF